jgi:GDSL-like Lipase/Acylhydrolase family
MRLRTLVSNVLALAVGLAIALVLGEIATRLIAPQSLSGSWLVYGPRGTMMNKADGGPVRNQLPDGTAVYYTFNSWHQRGKAEPDPAAARVLVLGDSFTFGFGLRDDDTYVTRLQKRFDTNFNAKGGGGPKVQLLNAATGGWGTDDQLSYLEDFGDGLGLSAVVVFFDFGDASRSTDVGPFVMRPDHQGLLPADRSAQRSRLKLLLEGNGFYEFLLEHSHLLQLARVASVSGLRARPTLAPAPRNEAETRQDEEMARLLFRRMAAWCKARDIQLTVLTTGWPMFHYLWLDPMMREEGVFFRDLHDPVIAAFGGRRTSDFEIPAEGHPNADGARVVADVAWPILDERLAGLPTRPFKNR